jgi:hypothetical protein
MTEPTQTTRQDLLDRRDALLREKEENNIRIADCRAQIDGAKADKKCGRQIDQDWFASVKAAARYAGHRDQEIAGELSSLTAEIRSFNFMEEGSRKNSELRDQIATAALSGMVGSGQHFDGQGDPERFSKLAYEYADAMLVARK